MLCGSKLASLFDRNGTVVKRFWRNVDFAWPANRVEMRQLPTNKLLLVNAWIELHREELIASWHAGRLTGENIKVEALW